MAVPGAVPIVATGPLRVELAGEGLVAVEGLRAREAGELGRDVGQREAAGGAGGDRGEVEDRPPGRVGVALPLIRFCLVSLNCLPERSR